MLTELKTKCIEFNLQRVIFCSKNILYTIKCKNEKRKERQNGINKRTKDKEEEKKIQDKKNSEMLIITYIFFKTNCSHKKRKQKKRARSKRSAEKREK